MEENPASQVPEQTENPAAPQPAEQSVVAEQPADAGDAATAPRTYSPEEMAEIEAEMDKRRAMIDMMKTHVLNQLEEESADSQFGALMRSKNFWYCVFGLIFFLWMGALILWVAHDLAK
ncbi:MAG: hypothetical protein IKO65_06510 [Victivallales bacterium]|nr:hypothetical protein [Victivallales bacterium]